MSAQNDFRKAHTHVINAQKLAKKHIDPFDYPPFFYHFDRLLETLDRCAILGVTEPPTKSEATHVS